MLISQEGCLFLLWFADMLTNSKTLAFTFAVITNLQINVVAGYFFLCSAEQSAFHTFLLVLSYLRYSRNSDHYKQTYGCVFVLFCFFYQNLMSICILLHTSSVSQICKKKSGFSVFCLSKYLRSRFSNHLHHLMDSIFQPTHSPAAWIKMVFQYIHTQDLSQLL